MTISQREHIAVEALRNIAKHDREGSGRYAHEALEQIERIDAAHLQAQTGAAKERQDRLTNMAADRMGHGAVHSPKTMGPMSPQEIEMGPGNMRQKTINWDNPKENLKPQAPEAYKTFGVGAAPYGANATDERREHDKLEEQREKNRQQARDDAKEHNEKSEGGKQDQTAQDHAQSDKVKAHEREMQRESDALAQRQQNEAEHASRRTGTVEATKDKKGHDLKASNLSSDKVGGGLDEKKK